MIPLLGEGRIVACEIMTGTAAIKTIIREGKSHLIDNIIRTSSEFGMTTLETVLANYVRQGLISMDEALSFSLHPEELTRMVKGSTQ